MSLLAFRLGGPRGIALLTLLATATLIAPIAQAQGAAGRAERADPLDARARVPAFAPVSALAGYRRLGDGQPIAWTQANERVSRIGGWRAYAREAQQQDEAASVPATTVTPAPAPGAAPNAAPGSAPGAAPRHSGHGMH